MKWRGMTMTKVKKILGDDIFGLWHVKQIIVNQDGKRFCFVGDDETFSSKEEAELHAHTRAQYFIQRKLGSTGTDGVSNTSWAGQILRSVLANTTKPLRVLGRTVCSWSASVWPGQRLRPID